MTPLSKRRRTCPRSTACASRSRASRRRPRPSPTSTTSFLAIIEGSTSAGQVRRSQPGGCARCSASWPATAPSARPRPSRISRMPWSGPPTMPPLGATIRDPPAPGTAATNRRQLSVIADEYRATFRAATIRNGKPERVDRACTRLLGFRDRASRRRRTAQHSPVLPAWSPWRVRATLPATWPTGTG